MMLFSSIIGFIFFLLSVAYFILLERKILSSIQLRQGPNKTSIFGILQPISDGVKLLNKTWFSIFNSNHMLYNLGPMFMMMFSMIIFMIIPEYSGMFFLKYSGLFFLVIFSMKVYGMFISAWSSNSKYSLLGLMRAVAQTISYEVYIGFILIFFLLIAHSMNFYDLYLNQNFPYFFYMLTLSILWYISVLIESHRSPFDLAEGESELVSGYNIEYGGLGFVFVFLGEYMSMLFLLLLCMNLFFGKMNLFFSLIFLSFFLFISVFIRGAFPRYRYDKLMMIMWKIFTPLCISMLIFFIPIYGM